METRVFILKCCVKREYFVAFASKTEKRDHFAGDETYKNTDSNGYWIFFSVLRLNIYTKQCRDFITLSWVFGFIEIQIYISLARENMFHCEKKKGIV